MASFTCIPNTPFSAPRDSSSKWSVYGGIGDGISAMAAVIIDSAVSDVDVGDADVKILP